MARIAKPKERYMSNLYSGMTLISFSSQFLDSYIMVAIIIIITIDLPLVLFNILKPLVLECPQWMKRKNNRKVWRRPKKRKKWRKICLWTKNLQIIKWDPKMFRLQKGTQKLSESCHWNLKMPCATIIITIIIIIVFIIFRLHSNIHIL